MERLSVQNTALFEGLLGFVKEHDDIHKTKERFYKRMRLQDSAGAIYTLTAQRDAGDDGLTSIKVISKWHPQLQLDTVVVARHIERNSPRSIRVVGSGDSISVMWFLQPGPYLVEPFAQRATDVITWISKLRFWVLSARLQQSLSVWTHTPSSSRTSMHCITPKLQMELPQRVQQLPCMCDSGTSPPPPVLRIALPRSAAEDDETVQRLLELLVFLPDLTFRWLVDVNMLMKREMRTFLETMRQSLEQ